jgi:vacuolar-type H+-ATPase subunit F/Vma7
MSDDLSIGVFGGSEFTVGFELTGINVIVYTDGLSEQQRIDLLFETLKHHDIGILIVDEKSLAGISGPDRLIIENYIRPVVIVLSEKASDTSSLRRQIIRAIGVDVYNEE